MCTPKAAGSYHDQVRVIFVRIKTHLHTFLGKGQLDATTAVTHEKDYCMLQYTLQNSRIRQGDTERAIAMEQNHGSNCQADFASSIIFYFIHSTKPTSTSASLGH